MNRKPTKIFAIISVVALSATAAHVWAGGSDNDAVIAQKAKLSLTEAVAIAEQHASGHAFKAELEQTKLGLAYDVEVVTPQKAVYDVAVDAQTGKVLRSEADKTDHDDANDGKD